MKNIKIEIEKQAKKIEEDKKPKEDRKVCFDVTIETTSPITLKYRIWAKTPHEAAMMAESGRIAPTSISKAKIIKSNITTLAVHLAGTINKLLFINRKG